MKRERKPIYENGIFENKFYTFTEKKYARKNIDKNLQKT